MINSNRKGPILFVLSVDTEEEWDWSGPFPQRDFSVNNIKRLPQFQTLCDGLGIRPTYFVDHAVADDAEAVDILKPIVESNRCEIGAHLHPWCNPPYFGYIDEKESHVINLPIEQVEEKLKVLVEKLQESFDTPLKSFRTGRWGIDGKVLQLLIKYGFKIDSSVYPFYQNKFYSCQGAPNLPYFADLDNPLKRSSGQEIYEIPVTAGFNYGNFELCEKLYRFLSHPTISWTRLVGLAWHSRLLRKSYLSPELFSIDEMSSLCRTALRMNYPILHMFIHSSSLIDNQNSLVGNKNAYEYICNAINEVVMRLKQETELHFCTISEATEILQQKDAKQ